MTDAGADPGVVSEVVWHDVECGAYEADLPLWEELAARADGAVLDLGCGTGRVGLHLARRGFEVLGVDREEALVAEFEARAAGLSATAVRGDARELALGREFPLALAPMQLIQLLTGAEERARCLRAIHAHLEPRGIAALALAEQVPAGSLADGPMLPDTREIDGVVYSSLPLEVAAGEREIVIRRLRQTVSHDGELAEQENEISLRPLTAARLEAEAVAAGFEPLPHRAVGATADHVGSTVVLLRKAGG